VEASAVMTHSLAHFLSDLFPEIEHPKYQSVLEKISFLAITTTILGALIAGLAAVIALLL
jgi:hypothetical protein